MKLDFYTKDGTLFATDYNRVVIGGAGPYIEFELEHIKCVLEIEPGQEYRYTEKYKYCKYYWLRPKGDSTVKVYHQKGTVSYADYQIGKIYVSPSQLVYKGDLYAEKGDEPGINIPTVFEEDN